MNGKSKCKALKEIRKKIATENDIPFVTEECKHKGNCKGTCPKCEAELRYLEEELAKRERAGRTVALAGVGAGIILGLTGCTPNTDYEKPVIGIQGVEQEENNDNGLNPIILEGDIALPVEPDEYELDGETEVPKVDPEPDPIDDTVELEGDVEYEPVDEGDSQEEDQ